MSDYELLEYRNIVLKKRYVSYIFVYADYSGIMMCLTIYNRKVILKMNFKIKIY